MKLQTEKTNDETIVYFEEALRKAGTGKYQFMVVIIGGLIIFSSYLSVGSVSYVLPAAQCDLHMDSEKKGRLASIGFVGLIISCHLWGFLSDTLGRRYILMRCLLLDGLLYIVTSITPLYSIILFLRLLNGFVASGGVASVYAYVGEFQTDKNRTKALMASAFVASFAYIFIPVIAWLTMGLNKMEFEIYSGLVFKTWRFYYAVCGIPSLMCAIFLYFLPESPKFLLAKGQKDEAIEILKFIHKFNNRSCEEFSIKDIRINENERVKNLDDNKNKVIAYLNLMWTQTAPLFKVPHRLNITLICMVMFINYLSNGGIYLWLPETMNRLANFKTETRNDYANFCEVVEYKSQILVEESVNTTFYKLKSDTNEENCSEDINVSVYVYLGVLGILESSALGIIMGLAKIFNKKYILCGLLSGTFLASVALKVVNITNFSAYSACIIVVFTHGVIPIINSVAVELFPTNLRGMASCLTLMSCRLGTVTTNILAGFFIDESCNYFIWILIILMFVGVVSAIQLPMKMKTTSNEKKEIKISSVLC